MGFGNLIENLDAVSLCRTVVNGDFNATSRIGNVNKGTCLTTGTIYSQGDTHGALQEETIENRSIVTDKKNKGIESREIRDSDSGSSLEAYIEEGILVSSMEQMGIFGVHESSLIEQIA
jgi:hypothetical protein